MSTPVQSSDHLLQLCQNGNNMTRNRDGLRLFELVISALKAD
ncbi:hypothetical protein MC7420_1060 [Coleofasciculus chthonoplastes PCC 7420]|uniref:Uncharacterized protein n=1 Tax=Coleofasciculus chthonoplastes PCC 7420 TaxID=118168 RepID=B4VXQ3_9CYAN|nr:hypothetical protein MC7420_1060 [Coleofasciculus chthonoplastes PCC 7420]